MLERIVFEARFTERGWAVTRDDKLVGYYSAQKMAERAMARMARTDASKGRQATAVLHKRDGTVASSRSYAKLTASWHG